MGFFSRLFGHKKSEFRTTTASNPFVIENPTIGFLNLHGERGTALMDADVRALSPLFDSCQVSFNDTPKCQVIFIYCTIDAEGKIVGSTTPIRDIIKVAGAYVAVIASENQPESYIKAMGRRNDWSANVALVIDRKADKFAVFFRGLFAAMFNGTSMLLAWVELAPQIPGHDHPDAPGTIMAAEAGHLTFTMNGAR